MTRDGTPTPPLTTLYVYLTGACNCACRHCWLSPPFDADGNGTPSLHPELFERAIGEAKPLGLRRVKLTGGEPLLHPRFSDLLASLRRGGLELMLETNGLLLTPETAAEIARSEGASVSVSLDGADARTHDGIRGVAGAFERACAAVGRLVAAGLRPQIIMTLTGGNIGEAEAMVDLASGLGAASLKFNLLQPTGRGRIAGRGAGAPGIAALIDLGRRFERGSDAGRGIDVFFDHPLAFRPLSRLFGGDGCGTCGIINILGLLPDGSWALCGIGTHVPELVFGKVGFDGLADLWPAHPVLAAIRESLPERLGGICGRCLMRRLCLGACLAQNRYRTGDLFAPFWFCDEAERLGLFPESRLEPAGSGVEKGG